jgi:hypothetical protein
VVGSAVVTSDKGSEWHIVIKGSSAWARRAIEHTKAHDRRRPFIPWGGALLASGTAAATQLERLSEPLCLCL